MELIEVSRAAAAASIARRYSQLCKFTTQIRQMQEILLHYAGCQAGCTALCSFGPLLAAAIAILLYADPQCRAAALTLVSMRFLRSIYLHIY